MNSRILTAFEKRCPLNTFSFLDLRITEIAKPKIDKMSISIGYHSILQVHSISCTVETLSWLATLPTSFIRGKARLVTRDFHFMCLHSIYITMVVTTNGIIAVTNRKMTMVKLLNKKVLLGKSLL